MSGTPRRDSPMVEFDGVTFAYRGADRAALADVTLTFGRGESVALVGPSGSGKSTLLRLVDALLLPTGGRVLVDGMDTRDESSLWDVRRSVGLIFQNPDNQLVSTTVERELAFGMENLGLPRAEIVSRVDEIATRLDIRELLSRAPHELSGGEKQRVAVAAVLAMRPACLALDEPTSLLDGQGRREIWDVLERVGSDPSRTVLHVTQFPDEIALASRVIVLVEGSVVFDGTPSDLFEDGERLARWGLARPPTAAIGERLASAGYAVPGGVPSLETLVESVARGVAEEKR
ncbi:MAG: ATP-binding cassette domain-containing protein [Candidatus Eisenbacteria bacterium]